MAELAEEHSTELYLGGRWVAAESTARIDVISPLTERVIGSVPAPTEREADAAVAAARACFDAGEWRRTPVKDRIDVLLRLADRYQAEVETMGLRNRLMRWRQNRSSTRRMATVPSSGMRLAARPMAPS